MTELKNCPFCGAKAVFGEVTGDDHPDFGGHFINCKNERCQACVGLRYAGKEDPRPLLAEQWNRRPEPSSLADDEDERGFTPSDYAHTAELLRSSEPIRKATASNNHNIILAALDLAAWNRRASGGSGVALPRDAANRDIVGRLGVDVFYGDERLERMAEHNPLHLDAIDEIRSLRAAQDQAYEERNRLAALLATMFPSGIRRTDIPGWSDGWHGCVYIDLPTGQVSWHYHDREAYLFAHLPPYTKPWDRHTTDEKYKRVRLLAKQAKGPAPAAEPKSIGEAIEACAKIAVYAGNQFVGAAERRACRKIAKKIRALLPSPPEGGGESQHPPLRDSDFTGGD